MKRQNNSAIASVTRLSSSLFSYIESKEARVKKVLLASALLVFISSVLVYGLSFLFPDLPIPKQLVPPTLLTAITPALSVLLVYELFLLTLATHGPFIMFVRREFEVISLIVLRDLFKILDNLAADTTQQLLTEVVVVMVGSIVLYFFVEVLERIERNFVGGELKQNLPGQNQILHFLKSILETGVLIFFAGLVAYEGIGSLVGMEAAGYGPTFLHIVFSALIIYNVIMLFITLLATDSYEVLFEHSALVLASIIVLIALEKDQVVGVPMIIGALLFVICTMFLHGFARGESLSRLFRKINK